MKAEPPRLAQTSESSRRSLHWITRLVVPLVIVVAPGLLVVGVTGFFTLSRDARCLRNSLTSAAGAQGVAWNKKIELRIGASTCHILRAGLSFVHLDPQAQTALRAVQGAEVGIYHVTPESGYLDHPALLAAADQAMAKRGWDRLVGVAKERELIAVYVPMGRSRAATLQACVAVLTRQELVVVSARSNLEPLMELACSQPEWKRQNWLPVRL